MDFLLFVQTGSWAHPLSIKKVREGSSLEGKAAGT
jgi:hypothetical protein